MSSPPPEPCPAILRFETVRCSRPAGHPGAHVSDGGPDGPLSWWDPRQQGPTPNQEMRDA